jgi:hypothetical protein
MSLFEDDEEATHALVEDRMSKITPESYEAERTELDEPFQQRLASVIQQRDSNRSIELLKYFREACEDRLQVLVQLKAKIPHLSHGMQYKIAQDISVIRKESDTWHMMYILFKDHLDIESDSLEEDEEMTLEDNWKTNQGRIIQRLMETNDQIRKQQLLVQWLEECSANSEESKDPLFTSLGYSRWDLTINAIHLNKKTVQPEQNRLVGEIDPDAPTRMGLSLVKSDEVCFLFH